MPQVQGNTTGLSPSAHKTLERLFRRRVPLEQLATPELVKGLADASRETGRQVAAMVHRSGDVEAVIVGDATKLMLPDVGRLRAAEGRLRGLRLIHTHLFGEELTKDDIVDLVRLRLDAIVAIQLAPDGEPRGIHVAHNVPPDPKALRDGEAQRRPPYRTLGPFLRWGDTDARDVVWHRSITQLVNCCAREREFNNRIMHVLDHDKAL